MAWWSNFGRYRSVSILMIVTVAHGALAAILLSQKLQPMTSYDPDVLDIELAELAPEIEVSPVLPVPRPAPEPAVPAEVPPPAAKLADPLPAPTPDPAPTPETQPVEDQSPTVLTQLEAAPSGTVTASNSTATVETPPGGTSEGIVTAAQVATALERMHCLKLKRHEEGACAPTDPFEAALANAERAIPEERLFGDPRYVAKSVSDKIFEREAANRFHWPDEDLFADPMAPGAYNARRIRNGQEPLWSQEMRDGFRKSED